MPAATRRESAISEAWLYEKLTFLSAEIKAFFFREMGNTAFLGFIDRLVDRQPANQQTNSPTDKKNGHEENQGQVSAL